MFDILHMHLELYVPLKTMRQQKKGSLRVDSLIESGQADIAGAPLIGQETAGVEVPHAMEAGGLVRCGGANCHV